MSLVLVTAPTTEPVTVDEVRTHLRLDSAVGEPAPTAPTVALASPAAAGNVDNGAHRYRVTFVTADGETDGGTISDIVTVADKSVNGQVAVSAIPLGGSAVTSRKLYRTIAAGASYLLLATISDNTTTTYTDNTADASLGAAAPTTNTTEDPILNALITATRQHAEFFLRRALITQTWDLKLPAFPEGSAHIRVPLPPLSSVTSITYTDSAGDSQTWAASKYQTDIPTGPQAQHGRIMPAYGEVYPSTRSDTYNAVTVRFVAGYGAASAVPGLIKRGMLTLLGHLYEHRETVLAVQGMTVLIVPQSYEWLLWPYRALDERVAV